MTQTPITLTIPHACERRVASRSYLYRLAAEGKIIFRKNSRRTLVDVSSEDKYFTSLPIAKIKAPTAREGTADEAALTAPMPRRRSGASKPLVSPSTLVPPRVVRRRVRGRNHDR